MQVTNNRVVHRSAVLLGYGDNFHYQESMAASNWMTGVGLGQMPWQN